MVAATVDGGWWITVVGVGGGCGWLVVVVKRGRERFRSRFRSRERCKERDILYIYIKILIYSCLYKMGKKTKISLCDLI